MNALRKRTLIKMIGLSAVSMAVLTACGKKEEAPAAPPAPPADVQLLTEIRDLLRQKQG